MREADTDGLAAMDRQIFDRPWSRNAFVEELHAQGGQSFGLWYHHPDGEKHLSGYICFRVFLDEMHILRIAVAPSWRRQGIASLVLERSLRIAAEKEAKTALLEVRQSNTGALSLYTNFGFSEIGRRKGYYPESGDGEDALVLLKQIM